MSNVKSSLHLRVVQLVCFSVVAVSAIGLCVQAPWVANATTAADSSLTVSWAGDTSAVHALQPTRDITNVHYASLHNLSVTVSQTAALGNQAVSVHVSGFAGTRSATDYSGQTWTSAMNFMQAMQCWGDPASATFNQTCEWGARYVPNNGLGSTVYPDNVLRVSTVDAAPKPTVTPAVVDPLDVPFIVSDTTAAKPHVVTGHEIFAQDAHHNDTTTPVYPLLEQFNAAISNEVQSARIASNGTGSFDFETEDATPAPQLGCGTAGHLTCYLVLVPRDTIYGGHDSSCSTIMDDSFAAYTYGRSGSIQAGSPVNPACDYWNNRMVVPLTFNPTATGCPSDGDGTSLGGSQLLVGAMSSWQPQLCHDLNTTFNFVSNADSVARKQLVQKQIGLVFGSAPVTAGELDDATATQVPSTVVSYAPVAVTSAVFAYQAEGPNGRIESLNLSPLLVAKLLTQSYVFTVPSNSSDPASNFLHLGAVNRRYTYWNQDPDFQALNPTNFADFTSNPSIILPNSSADAIGQVWKWIDADPTAVAWLGGAPDRAGMTVNPFYLPLGNAAAQVPTFSSDGTQVMTAAGAAVTAPVGLSKLDGSPLTLSSVPQNTFIKADASLVPLRLSTERSRFSSVQFAPYAADFVTAARSAFRADPGAKTIWDNTAIDSAGDAGAWVGGGAQIPGQRFAIAFTDSASAKRYNLNTAALQIDNTPNTFVLPTDATLQSALASTLVATSNPAVSAVNPALATAGAYPLTMVVYAAVNLSGTDAAARSDFSKLITQITTTGQVPGVGIGQLPPGYVPLTAAQTAQAATAASAIKTYVAPVVADAPITTQAPAPYAQDDYTGAAGASTQPATTGPAQQPAPTQSAAITPITEEAAVKTPKTDTPWIAQQGLIGSLGLGLLGGVSAPVFFRRRRIL